MELSGETLSIAAVVLGILLAQGMEADEADRLGDFLEIVGDTLGLIASERRRDQAGAASPEGPDSPRVIMRRLLKGII